MKLILGVGYLVAAYVLFDAAADELSAWLGELFADAVISTDNGTEGS